MNLFAKMIRSIQESSVLDRGFESYYGAVIRTTQDGGPTAAEARRDFMAARSHVDRISII